jgi:hypothetical protein
MAAWTTETATATLASGRGTKDTVRDVCLLKTLLRMLCTCCMMLRGW